MKLILKNATINNPFQKLNKISDLLLEDGIIIKIGKISEKEIKDVDVIDLTGMYIVPGFFDMHIHLREPGQEHKETIKTGCDSAAAGGFTGVACMPNTNPAIDSAETVLFIKEKSNNHLVDVFPIGAATLGRKGETLAPIAELKEAGVVALSDDGVAIKTSALVKNAMEYAKMYDLPIIEHCEDESLAGGSMNEGLNSTLLGLPPIPSIAEDLTIARDIIIAEYTGGKLHIAHISTKKGVELVREAKKKGIKVTTEVTPHHFILTDDAVQTYDTNAKMNPPLRTAEDVKAMIEGLKDGTIDCIASDHAPHSIEEKEVEFEYAPNGIVGLETQVGLTLSELYHKKILSLEEIIEKLSINPRKILNIPVPQFKEGETANFTILDLNLVWKVEKEKLKSKSKNTPFDKYLLTGKAVGVINKKKMLYNGEFKNI